MSIEISTKEYLSSLSELLASGKGPVSLPIRGTSMTPFLHNGDIVLLDAVNSPPKAGDIVLYTREDGSFVLHRILKENAGVYTMAGDSQSEKETDVPLSSIRAVVIGGHDINGNPIEKGGRAFFYRIIWRSAFPCRAFLLNAASIIKGRNKKK